VHRIGRTGRAGANGTAISFCDAEERAFLKDIEKLIAKKIPVIENHPFPMTNFTPIKEAKQQGRGNSGHARSKAMVNGGQKRRFSSPRTNR
jgi:ATP-dependent RNA helicase RhlE